MTDEPKTETEQAPTVGVETMGDPTVRLVPLSDIEAFVEVRAGSILDEAAILAIQFLGGGDRDKARMAFVRLAMEHFDSIGAQYDEIRWETAMRARREIVRARREAEKKAAEAAATPEKKDE